MNINGIQRLGYRGVRLLQKHSPTILTVIGAGGVIGTAVLASKATIHAVPVFEDLQERIWNVKTTMYESDREQQKELVHVYRKGIVDIAKIYAPAALAALGSVACIIAAHGIMKRRNVALIAAVSLLEQSFKEYRQRVIEEFGEDKDRDYRLGIYDEQVEGENGKKKTVRAFHPDTPRLYAKIFDEGNPNWEPDPEYNLGFLKIRQEMFNQKLQTRGHLFLNEVYEELGFEHTKAGAVCGWVISKDGDNFVDIGLYNADTPDGQHRFINGLERSIILDFNVDGVIVDKI